jgi:hypothetical protein
VPTPFREGIAVTLSVVAAAPDPAVLPPPVELLLQAATDNVNAAASAAPAAGSRSVFREFLMHRIRI